jgi:hypothetical protein
MYSNEIIILPNEMRFNSELSFLLCSIRNKKYALDIPYSARDIVG